MTCDAFRVWYDSAEPHATAQPPEPLRRHLQTCLDCQAFLRDESVWQRLFATVPDVSMQRSLWPGVLAEIEARQTLPTSLSAAVWALGRLVVPVCALVVLCLGGFSLWRGVFLDSQTAPVVSSLLLDNFAADVPLLQQDPETIVQRWMEGTGP